MDIRFITLGLALQLAGMASYNTDTSSFRVLKGPRENSFFGYSVAVARVNGSVEVWSGSPKYAPDDSAGVVKEGAIYQCKVVENGGGDGGGELNQSCKKLQLKTTVEKQNADDDHTNRKPLPEKALECVFDGGACDFEFDGKKLWLLGNEYMQKSVQNIRRNRKSAVSRNRDCVPGIPSRVRLTGPPAYTVHGGIIVVNSAVLAMEAHKGRRSAKTSMTTQWVEARRGVTQCLRFCYNAYSALDNRKGIRPRRRRISVFLQYDDPSTNTSVYQYRGLRDTASQYWNFTEIDIEHERDGRYKIHFEVSLGVRYKEMCNVAADIAFADISVKNSPCEEEPEDIDVMEEEQSVGMSLDVKVEDEGRSTLTACGSLWQQDCGFAKEAAGICYEMKSNGSAPTVVRNPELQGCIRGKIDIVLLVDQSGSVNQCNFQKVKKWLRNIVRGFAIGPEQQDIGIVVYSSEERTTDAFSLGFKQYGNSGAEKRLQMLKQLRDLPYEAGRTFTGVAFQHANDMLWGPNGRPDAKKMVILLTDGATTDEDRINLQQQVADLRQRNGVILAVGVAKYDEQELKNISGSEEHFFPVKDFSELEQVRDTLRQTVSHTNLEGSRRSTSLQNCQMGFSLHGDKDALLMGSPGCFDRVGNVMRFAKHENDNGEIDEGSSEMDDFFFSSVFPTAGSSEMTTAADYTVFRSNANYSVGTASTLVAENTPMPGLIEIPTLTDVEHALRRQLDDSYLGYAVTSGNFFGEAEGIYVAASAPRHLGSGSVLVYKPSSLDPVSNSRVIRGMQLGEYFGAYLCAEDVNSDGYTDLLVGAPLHIGNNSDEGRVYVYMGGKNMSAKPDVILEGEGSEFSRFGLVITSVGDVTSDGFTDIVVSAPHEEEGRGAVYIFNGGKNGLTGEYTQRVAASSFSDGDTFRLFGQSVAGGTDLDNNNYPDILVGAPGSDRVIILRTRPVVRVDVRFFIRTSPIDRKDNMCFVKNASALPSRDDACVICAVCFSYSSRSPPPAILIRYRISPDTTKAKARVRFHDGHDNQREIRRAEIVRGAGSLACFDHTLHLESNVEDLMTNVTMRLNFDMDENATTESGASTAQFTSSALRPVLDRTNKREFTTEAEFKTYCEDTSSCVADISLNQSGPVSKNGDPVETYELDETSLVRYRLRLMNRGPEEAHAVLVTLFFPASIIQFMSLKTTDCFKQLGFPKTDGPDDGIGVVKIVLKDTFLGPGQSCNGLVNFLVKTEASSRQIDGVPFSLRAETVSRDDNLLDNERNATVAVGLKTSFELTGESLRPWFVIKIPTNSTHSTNNTEPLVESFEHVYTLSNIGPFAIQNLSVVIQWPACVKDGERSRYVRFVGVSRRRNGGTGDYAEDEDISSENNFVSDPAVCDADSREKDCISHYVSHCPSITSRIKLIEPRQRINIRLSGEIDPLQYKDIEKQLIITTVLKITVNDKRRLIFSKEKTLEQSIATQLLLPAIHETTEEKPLFDYQQWVYIVISVVAGLLLLLFVIFLLWRLGCLKSKYASKKKELEDEMMANPESTVPMTSEA